MFEFQDVSCCKFKGKRHHACPVFFLLSPYLFNEISSRTLRSNYSMSDKRTLRYSPLDFVVVETYGTLMLSAFLRDPEVLDISAHEVLPRLFKENLPNS